MASMEPWQAVIAKRVDALVVMHVPGVRKAVRWHCAFYGVEGQGWFLASVDSSTTSKFSFFKGTSLKPVPPIGQIQGRALPRCARVGQDRREAAGDLDQAGGLHPRLGRRIHALRRTRARASRQSGHAEGRPEKVGAYRMFMRLRHDHRAIPEPAQIFRVSGWQRALVVDEPLAGRLRRCISPCP